MGKRKSRDRDEMREMSTKLEKRGRNSDSKKPDKEDKREKRNNDIEKIEKHDKKRNRKNNESEKIEKMLSTKSGGAYIPPAKLKLMQDKITDKSSAAYQRIAWEALKKSIHGLINKINTSNIGIIAKSLLEENIIRGRGLLCRSLLQAQGASPKFTNVYAALIAIINSKFPNIGELFLTRLLIQFKRSYRRNEKLLCIPSVIFIAHLVNQKVAHEIVALEILILLVENSTDDSIEVAMAILKECGLMLTKVCNKGINTIFERLRNILHEGKIDKRVQYMIEVMFQIRKDRFKDYPSVIPELNLINEDDQITHVINLDEMVENTQDLLNVFQYDPEYILNEERYANLKKGILGDDADESEGGGSGEEDDEEEDEEEDDEESKQLIIDKTETDLIAFRRTVYLTINSSLDFEECAHKLLRIDIKPGQELELCNMFVDCCAEQRTYEKFYGLLGERFCRINRVYQEPFKQILKDSYNIVHRFETNKLRNVAKFFAHLLYTDAIPWDILSIIRLNEEDTTSSSRVFIKILFQELCEFLGLFKLNSRLKDPSLQEAFEGLFPKDNPKNTRFSINFFTSIGLGGLTDDLREHLKLQVKKAPPSPTLSDMVKTLPSKIPKDEPLSPFPSSSIVEKKKKQHNDTSKKSKKKKKHKHKSKDKKRKKLKDKDSLLKQSTNLTDHILRVSRQLADTSKQNADTLELLIRSSNNVTGIHEELKSTGTHIDQSERLLNKYQTRDFTDKLLVFFAFSFFFICVLYVLYSRI